MENLPAAIEGNNMSYEIKELKLPLQKVIELGTIDRWLRGIAKIVPLRATPAAAKDAEAEVGGLSSLRQDFNTHTLSINRSSLVGTDDIERMVGFRSLLNAASANNVSLNVSSVDGAALEIAFDPDKNFSRSHIFGASYANVLPAAFTGRRSALKA